MTIIVTCIDKFKFFLKPLSFIYARPAGGGSGTSTGVTQRFTISRVLPTLSFRKKLQIIFEIEKAMETAIANCAPVEEIKSIIARKKRS